MTDRELMQQALYALQESKPIDINDPTAFYRSAHAIEALRARLAQPEPEPVAWQCAECGGTHSLCLENRKDIPLYTALPQREWVGLTEEEVEKIANSASSKLSAIYIVEAELKGKNYDKS